jgi:methylmalonyl-CoA mutase
MSHPVAKPYVPKHKIRIVTAASLFDGHDAAINIMRRIIQATGAEVIHLGHDRSVEDVVNTAIQEDAHAIAMTSYQGGHNEYFKYMFDLLKERGAAHIRIFGGGGGTILPSEIEDLHQYGITRLYHPDDGRAMGLQGMINDMLEQADFDLSDKVNGEARKLTPQNWPAIAKLISTAENHPEVFEKIADEIHKKAAANKAPILGITGTGGAGKSSMVDELIRRFILDQPTKTIGVISVDPSKRKTGGALLGDRIRMNSIRGERVYMRSLATRQSNLALSKHVKEAVSILKAAGFDLIVLETSGIGQSDTEILDHSDVSLYIMTPEFGAATQLEKIDMLDFADVVAINKFDKRGAMDALRDVKKQYKRNHQLWDAKDEDLPVVGTIASQFNDPGTNTLYERLMRKIKEKTGTDYHSTFHGHDEMSEKVWIIPPAKSRYLSEISENNRRYDERVDKQAGIADQLYGLYSAVLTFGGPDLLEATSHEPNTGSKLVARGSKLGANDPQLEALTRKFEEVKKDLDPHLWAMLTGWKAEEEKYGGEFYTYLVRGKEIKVPNHSESLSHLKIPKVALPKFRSWGDKVRWAMQENTPGFFPYTAGIYPFKRTGEDPARMFAGEGGPERTNKRFHYVSQGLPAKRLSTAFDSVTLYGHDPGRRPDIYGKVGNAGVSICCLDDAKKLYSGFDLSDPKTSVSMTINGPAPMLLGFFMNAAIDQNCEKYILANGLKAEVERKIAERWAASHEPRATSSSKLKARGSKLEAHGSKLEAQGSRPHYIGEVPNGNNGLGLLLLGITGDQVLPPDVYAKIKADTLTQVRGTVQADILKEDQAQNTCIFSTEFALRLDGRRAAVLHRSEGPQLLQRQHQRLPHRGGRRQPHQPARLHPGQRLHLRGVLPQPGHGHQRLRAEPELLLQQRHGPRVRRDGPRGAPPLGQGAQAPLRRRRAQPDAQVPHPDQRPQPPRAGDRLQRHPHHVAGALRHLRQLQQPAHQRLRRGHHHAHRGKRAPRHGHPAHHQQGARPGQEREPAARQLHHRRAHRPGGRGRAHRVRPHHRTRRRARRHGDHVPAQPHPGREPLLRDAEAQRRLSDHRRQHLPQLEGFTHSIAEGSDPRHGSAEREKEAQIQQAAVRNDNTWKHVENRSDV